jgi:esterase/lipase superfamily enzyme
MERKERTLLCSRIGILTVVVPLALGCSSSRPAVDTPDEVVPDSTSLIGQRGDEEGYAVVQVFYGTDRIETGSDSPGERYGTTRGAGVSYGTVEVSIPRDHRLGEIERPAIRRLEFREDPEKHVVLLSVKSYDGDEFFERLAARVAVSEEREGLVFIHGYNVAFDEAARRTAQIAYDIGFGGAPIFYSWPSAASLSGYPADETNILWATPHIKQFLIDVATRTEADVVHLIAHSMGNRGLTGALVDLADEGRTDVLSKFQEIILTAPDIDAEIFKRDILPRLLDTENRVTLYASARDRALTASKEVHNYPRAGDAGENLVVAEGLHTIDATEVTTGFLGHSYFAEDRSVIGYLFYLVRERRPPDQRFGLERVEGPSGVYWRVRD